MAKKITAPSKGLPGGQYKPLTDEQVKQIQATLLSILSRQGFVIQ